MGALLGDLMDIGERFGLFAHLQELLETVAALEFLLPGRRRRLVLIEELLCVFYAARRDAVVDAIADETEDKATWTAAEIALDEDELAAAGARAVVHVVHRRQRLLQQPLLVLCIDSGAQEHFKVERGHVKRTVARGTLWT